jgi:hypothetical protein
MRAGLQSRRQVFAAPDPTLNPAAGARFWVEQGERRWQAACAIERLRGVAVCDTDPIKLHYIWSLWHIGVAAERVWQAEHVATRDAIADGRIGFADAYLVKGSTRSVPATAGCGSDDQGEISNFTSSC